MALSKELLEILACPICKADIIYEEENQKMQMRLNRANNELRSADMNARTKVFQQLQQYAQDILITKGGHKIVFERGGGILAFAPGMDRSTDITKVIKVDMAKKAKAKEVKAKESNMQKQAAAPQSTEQQAKTQSADML